MACLSLLWRSFGSSFIPAWEGSGVTGIRITVIESREVFLEVEFQGMIFFLSHWFGVGRGVLTR